MNQTRTPCWRYDRDTSITLDILSEYKHTLLIGVDPYIIYDLEFTLYIYNIGVSWNGVTPISHPKTLIIFSRKKTHGLLGISPPFCGKNLEEASIGRCASGGSGPYLGNSFQGNIPLMGPQNPTPRMMILPFFYRVLIHPRWLFGISSINSYLSGLFKIAGWNIPMFLIGNTSSIRVHFPYVSLPEGNVKFVPFIAHPQASKGKTRLHPISIKAAQLKIQSSEF